MTAFRTWEDYLYPKTAVLRNRHGIEDADALRALEEQIAFQRLVEMLFLRPVPGAFDREHMLAIHHRLFGEVYEWAGQLRVGPGMSKGGPSPESISAGNYGADDRFGYGYFAGDEAMVEHFDKYVGMLHERRPGFVAMDRDAFVEAIVEPWAEMNSAHLFREGNTRSQVVFFTYLARAHGHNLDYDRFSLDEAFRLKFNAGRFRAQHAVDYSLLAEALREVVDAPPRLNKVFGGGGPSAGRDYAPHYITPDDQQPSVSS